MDYQTLGRQVRALRLQRGMTQEQLAEAAELSVPYISHIERGRKRASLETLERLAEALGITVAGLLAGAQTQA